MKKFKTKRKNKKLVLWLFLVFSFLLFIWISFKNLNSSYEDIVNLILVNTNFSRYDNSKYTKKIGNISLFFPNYKFKKKDIVVFNNQKEYVYIYNTHDEEMYYDNTKVIEASNMLAKNLNKLGINSIVEEKKVSSYQNNGLNNYEISRKFMEERKEDIKYYIDVHRDSVKNTTIEIKNKKYAKIMFVLGLENDKYLENKIVMQKMNDYLNSNYPGISRGIYEKKGKDVNGIYNQDYSRNVLLMEVGGIENTIDEVNNSTEIIALMLYTMLGDNK